MVCISLGAVPLVSPLHTAQRGCCSQILRLRKIQKWWGMPSDSHFKKITLVKEHLGAFTPCKLYIFVQSSGVLLDLGLNLWTQCFSIAISRFINTHTHRYRCEHRPWQSKWNEHSRTCVFIFLTVPLIHFDQNKWIWPCGAHVPDWPTSEPSDGTARRRRVGRGRRPTLQDVCFV